MAGGSAHETTIKALFLFFVVSLASAAEGELVSIVCKGKVEQYWVMYASPDGKLTKIRNTSSGIDFFIETAYLNAITISRQLPAVRAVRVRRFRA